MFSCPELPFRQQHLQHHIPQNTGAATASCSPEESYSINRRSQSSLPLPAIVFHIIPVLNICSPLRLSGTFLSGNAKLSTGVVATAVHLLTITLCWWSSEWYGVYTLICNTPRLSRLGVSQVDKGLCVGRATTAVLTLSYTLRYLVRLLYCNSNDGKQMPEKTKPDAAQHDKGFLVERNRQGSLPMPPEPDGEAPRPPHPRDAFVDSIQGNLFTSQETVQVGAQQGGMAASAAAKSPATEEQVEVAEETDGEVFRRGQAFPAGNAFNLAAAPAAPLPVADTGRVQQRTETSDDETANYYDWKVLFPELKVLILGLSEITAECERIAAWKSWPEDHKGEGGAQDWKVGGGDIGSWDLKGFAEKFDKTDVMGALYFCIFKETINKNQHISPE